MSEPNSHILHDPILGKGSPILLCQKKGGDFLNNEKFDLYGLIVVLIATARLVQNHTPWCSDKQSGL